MTKIKIFNRRQFRTSDLEDDINAWFAEHSDVYIKDIKVCSAPVTKVDIDSNVVICIIYQEGDPE